MTEHFLKQFKNDVPQGPAWETALRQGAIKRFEQLGFPTVQWEEWKYTPVTSLTQIPFLAAKEYRPNGFKKENLGALSLGASQGVRLVFVNGHFARELSSQAALPKGMIAGSLAEILKENPGAVEGKLSRQASFQDHPFVALNTAFFRDGAFLYLPKDTFLKDPVELLFLSHPSEAPTVSHPRNLVIAEAGSQVSIVESYAGGGSQPYFTNAVTEIVAESGAQVDHYKIQQEEESAFHFATLAVKQERESRFHSHSLSLGGALARNDLTSVLVAEGGECHLNGLYLAKGKQRVDNHTNIDHAHPRCTSSELYKGVLDGEAQAVFNGRIVVRPHAEKTSARQYNKNLLLSNEAAVNTKPLLEIFNNDVKCNHGATIGRLDENQVFYLRSRGIGDELARHLLIYAFAADVVSAMKVPALKTHLQKLLFSRFVQGQLPLEGLGGFA